jgi:hypothetical protein
MKKILIIVGIAALLAVIAVILSPELRDSFSEGFNKGIGEQ